MNETLMMILLLYFIVSVLFTLHIHLIADLNIIKEKDDFIVSNIIISNKTLNIFGKILLIAITFPCILIEGFIYLIFWIATYHPKTK